MRILFYIPALNAGGSERVMVTLANYCYDRGDEVEILTFNKGGSFYALRSDNILHEEDISIKRESGFLRKLEIVPIELKRRTSFIKEVKHYKPDVVLSFLYTSNIIAISAKKKINVPLVISERNDPTSYPSATQNLCKKYYPKADILVCQSNYVKKYYLECNAKCEVIPNPLNTTAIGMPNGIRMQTIVAVGRLIPQKNHKLLINAFDIVHKENSELKLEIYGEGPLEGQLQEQIKALGLEKCAFLCGTRKNVMKHIANYACFVLPSDFEGFPNVLIEAMASGLPVVSTDFATGIAKELIVDGKNGYIVPTRNKDKLVEAIRTITKSVKLQDQMGVLNSQIAERYSEQSVCNQWRELLLSAIKKNN